MFCKQLSGKFVLKWFPVKSSKGTKMTTIEVVSFLFKVIDAKEYEDEDVIKLKRLLAQIHHIESHIYENAILPRFVEEVYRLGALSKDEHRIKAVLELLKLFTEKTYLTNEKAFKTVVFVLLGKVYDPVANVMRKVGETELISILECIETLSRRLEGETVEKFYKKENATMLGQLIYVSLECMQKDVDMEVRLSALSCLMSVLQVHNDFDTNDIVLRAQISDLVLVMAPRVFLVLSQLVMSDVRMPQKLRAKALKAFGRVLCLIFEQREMNVMTDEVTQDDFLALVGPVTQSSGNHTELRAIEGETNLLERKRRTFVTKLAPTLEFLPTLLSPDYSPLVHVELLELSHLVLLKCGNCLQDNILVFYEILLMHDGNSEQFVHQLNSRLLMKKGFDRHLLRFPRIIHRRNEQHLLLALRLLNGYLRFFQQTSPFILTNTETIEQIFSNLLLLLELQYPLLCLEEALDWNDMSLNVDPTNLAWRQHKHIFGKDLNLAVNEIVRTLQHQTLFRVIINKVFDKLVTDSNTSNELICLLLRLLRCQSEIIDEQLLVEQILTEFLQDHHWYCEVRQSTGVDPHIPLEELHFNVIHICLAIEVISTCSSHVHSNMEEYLFNVIPKVLEKAGNRNILIHSAALHGLELISKGLAQDSVNTLIKANVDFISHYIEVRLRRDDIKNGLDMANALLELYADYDNFHFIQGLFVKMKEMFTKTSISDENLTAALKITLNLLKKLKLAREKVKGVQKCETEKPNIDAQQLLDQWSLILNPPFEPEYDPKDTEFDFDEMKKEMEDIGDENEDPDTTETDIEETTENVFLGELIRTLLSFVSSSNTIHKLYSLDAVGHCLCLLDTQNKEFLPTIHLIWSPLATRFKENNLLVVSRTFDLLLLITQLSKDFVQKRASTEVLPCILAFLSKSVTENLENTGSFASILTQDFKLQQKIFTNIGAIFQHLDVHEKILDDLLNACLGFLRSDQSKMVKQSCWKLLRTLFTYDATGVLVKIHKMKEFKNVI